MDLSDARSILVVKPSSLGDVVHALPVLPILRARFPDVPVRWLVRPEWAPLLEGHPDLEATIPFPRDRFRGIVGLARFGGWARGLRKLEHEVPEVALDFQGLFRSGLIPRLRGCAGIIGFRDARECGSLFYSTKLDPPPPPCHAVDRNLALLAACGLEVPAEPEFHLPGADLDADGLDLPDRFVLVHPFARGTGKALPAEHLAALIDRLDPAPVVVVGRSQEAVPQDERVVDLVNRTSLSQLAEVCRRAAALVSMDSGPMHVAAAVAGDRLLGIHTWTDTRKVGPYHPQAKVWKARRIAGRGEFSEEEMAAGGLPEDDDLEAIASWALGRGGW